MFPGSVGFFLELDLVVEGLDRLAERMLHLPVTAGGRG